MKRIARYILPVLLVSIPSPASQASATAASSRRSVVLFPFQGGPAEPEQAQIGRLTEALQAALQATGRFEVLLFHPHAPLVRQALAQGVLTKQQLEDPSESNTRLEIAKALRLEAFLSGEIRAFSFTSQPKTAAGAVEVNIEIREVKVPRWIVFQAKAEAQIRTPRPPFFLRTAAAGVSESPPAPSEAAQRQAIAMALARTLVSRIEEVWPVLPPEPLPEERPAASAAPEHFTDPLEEARQRAAAGDLAAAVRFYTAAIAADPGNPNLYVELGDLLAQGGQWAQACKQYERALRVDSQHLPAYRRLTEAYHRLQRPQDEIATWHRLISLGETGEEVERALAKAYQANGDYAEAVAHYERAIALSADPYPLLVELGQWAEEQQDLPTAAARYEAARALRRRDPAAHRQLLAFHLRHRESEQALACLREFLELAGEGNSGLGLGTDLYQPVLYLLDNEIERLEGKFEKLRQEHSASTAFQDPLQTTLEELDLHIQDLVNLADRIQPEEPYQRSHRHRVLAYSLLDQAVVEYLQFLATGEALSRERSALLVQQSRDERKRARDLERQVFQR